MKRNKIILSIILLTKIKSMELDTEEIIENQIVEISNKNKKNSERISILIKQPNLTGREQSELKNRNKSLSQNKNKIIGLETEYFNQLNKQSPLKIEAINEKQEKKKKDCSKETIIERFINNKDNLHIMENQYFQKFVESLKSLIRDQYLGEFFKLLVNYDLEQVLTIRFNYFKDTIYLINYKDLANAIVTKEKTKDILQNLKEQLEKTIKYNYNNIKERASITNHGILHYLSIENLKELLKKDEKSVDYLEQFKNKEHPFIINKKTVDEFLEAAWKDYFYITEEIDKSKKPIHNPLEKYLYLSKYDNETYKDKIYKTLNQSNFFDEEAWKEAINLKKTKTGSSEELMNALMKIYIQIKEKKIEKEIILKNIKTFILANNLHTFLYTKHQDSQYYTKVEEYKNIIYYIKTENDIFFLAIVADVFNKFELECDIVKQMKDIRSEKYIEELSLTWKKDISLFYLPHMFLPIERSYEDFLEKKNIFLYGIAKVNYEEYLKKSQKRIKIFTEEINKRTNKMEFKKTTKPNLNEFVEEYKENTDDIFFNKEELVKIINLLIRILK
jgi:hypothetical protein